MKSILEVSTAKTMKKVVSFSTLLTAIVASGLLAITTKTNTSEQQKTSAIALEEISQLGESSTFDVSNNNGSNNINRIVGFTGLGIGTGVIAYHLSRANKPSFTDSLLDNNSLLLDRVSPKLRQKLLRLVHNRPTANRLLVGAMSSHSNRSPNWLAEKVIYDFSIFWI